MIEPHRLIPGIRQFCGEKMYLVYGNKDPSYKMVKLHSVLSSEKVEFVHIKNADHDFTGFLDFSIELPSVYLFGEKIKSKSAFQITRNLMVMW